MRIFSRLLSLALSAGLAACGGGSVGNDTGSPVSAIGGTVLSGVAATGAALVGAVVTARCATGPDVSAGTAADGSFTLSLPADRTLPCMLKATGGAPMVTLYSFAGSGGRVNLTPLTDFVVARALASDPAAAFDGFDANKGATILAGLAGAKAYVSAQIGAFIGSTLSIDAITGTFVVGDPNDQVLDVLGAAMRATGSSIADLRAVSVGGVVATVVTVGSIPIDHVRVLAGSTAGTGVYSAVTAQESGDFLTLLNVLCGVKTPDGSGGGHAQPMCTWRFHLFGPGSPYADWRPASRGWREYR